jgi:hypothetical protein
VKASLAAVMGIALVVAGFITAGLLHQEAGRHGFDEIAYVRLHSQVIQPGQSASQPVKVQASHLSRIAFLYSYVGEDQAPVNVTVRANGVTRGGSHLNLPPTLKVGDREAWWSFQAIGDAAPNAWQTLARFQEVPVSGPLEGPLIVTISIPLGGRPVILYWNPSNTLGPPSLENPSRHFAIRTEYDPVQPALFKGPAFAQRMGHYGSPWMPSPAVWALAALLCVLLSILSLWLVKEWPGIELASVT